MLLNSLHELTNSQVRAHQTIATHMRNTLNLSITKRIAPVGVAREWGWRGVWKRHNLYRLCTSKK